MKKEERPMGRREKIQSQWASRFPFIEPITSINENEAA